MYQKPTDEINKQSNNPIPSSQNSENPNQLNDNAPPIVNCLNHEQNQTNEKTHQMPMNNSQYPMPMNNQYPMPMNDSQYSMPMNNSKYSMPMNNQYPMQINQQQMGQTQSSTQYGTNPNNQTVYQLPNGAYAYCLPNQNGMASQMPLVSPYKGKRTCSQCQGTGLNKTGTRCSCTIDKDCKIF